MYDRMSGDTELLLAARPTWSGAIWFDVLRGGRSFVRKTKNTSIEFNSIVFFDFP